MSIVALVAVGTLTGCTNSTPVLDGAEKVATTEVKKEVSNQVEKVATTEVKKEVSNQVEKVATTEVKKEVSNQVVKVVKDKAISVAKTVAVGAATKKVKEMASKK